MQTYTELINTLKAGGLESIGMYYSIYPATVSDNNDPKKQGRLKVSVPQLTDNQVIENWAYPVAPLSSSGAFLSLPKNEEQVWIVFRGGDVRYPLWLGGWWKKDIMPELAKTDYPLLHVWTTPEGNSIVMNDRTKELSIVDASGNEVKLQSGAIIIQVKDGGKVTVNGSIVELNGAAEFAVLGNTVQTELTKLNAKFEALCTALAAWTPTGVPTADIAALKLAITAPVALTAADFAAILSSKVKLS